jgi:predicted dienelactone hydrolase
MMNLRHLAGRLLFVSILLSVLPLFTLAQDGDATTVLPMPSGPYRIGTLSRYWIDEARTERFTANPDDKRELMVQFWYPAEVEEGATPAPYLPNSDLVVTQFNTIFNNLRGANIALSPEKFASLQSHAFLDVPIANDQTTYPILVVSHGLAAVPAFLSTQIEELASHGYIVAAINHTYLSTATVFPDGRVVTMDPLAYGNALFTTWAEDAVFVLDQLEAMNTNDPEGIFNGRLNMDQVGALGFSFGGTTATLACWMDSRFRAGVNEDGPVVGEVLTAGLDQPFMFMHAEGYTGANEYTYGRLRGPAYDVVFSNGFLHGNFSDAPLWPDNEPLIAASEIGAMDGLRSAQLTNAYVLAFFDRYLKGEDEPLLDGLSSEYPEATIRSRNT